MQPAPAGSLLEFLQQIPDPRGRQGRRHSLEAMLASIVCALLCGERGYSGISDWVHSQPREVWYWLGFTRRPPKLGAFRDLLMVLPANLLEDVIRQWVTRLLGNDNLSTEDEAPLQAVAMDGKTLRGSLAKHQRAIHLLSLLDQRTGYTLSQSSVDGKTNEHKAALELLKTMVLKGRVVTGDAMFCQRDLCQQIIDQGGHYFFEVKDNQPNLKESIEADFQSAFSPLQRPPAA